MAVQYSGSPIVSTTFNVTTKSALQSTVITNLLAAGWSQLYGPAGGGSQIITISIASPGVVTFPIAHNLRVNDVVVLSTTGALPTGLSAAVYYVKTIVNSTQITLTGSVNGAVINTSGTQSGTQSCICTCMMQTATTPWGVKLRVRLQDNNATCITFSIENSTSTVLGANTTGNGGYVQPNSAVFYHMIANSYQAFILGPNGMARGFVAFGTPYLPAFLQSVITECGWMVCNSASDSDGSRNSLRNLLIQGQQGAGGTPNSQTIHNALVLDMASQGSFATWGCPKIFGFYNAMIVTGQNGIAWHDGSLLMVEPLIGWGNALSVNTGNAAAAEILIRGQLWDAVLIHGFFPADMVSTFAGHNWWNVTDTDTGDAASLWLCTS
jgi:hypothetical protein